MKKCSTFNQGRDYNFGIPFLSIFLLFLIGASLQFQTYAQSGDFVTQQSDDGFGIDGNLLAGKLDCLITGPDELCPLGMAQYWAPDTMVSYAWSVNGSGVILGDPTLQMVDVQGNGGCDTSFTLNLTIVGSNGLPNTCEYVVSLVDTSPPVISNVPGLLLLNCPSEVPLATIDAVKVTDNCQENVIVTVSDSIINHSCESQFDVIRTWTAEDQCGNLSTASQYIMVYDSIGPVFTHVPNSLWLECTSEIPGSSAVSVTVEDDCNDYIVLSVFDTIINFSCMNQFEMIRTWTAEDMCGNQSTASQSITVFDSTAPVIEGVPDDTAICCEELIPNLSHVTATDNCSVTELVSFTKMVSDSTSPTNYTLKMTWVYADLCGNMASDSMFIEVNSHLHKAGKGFVGIDKGNKILSNFRVAPNPFNHETTISFIPARDAFYELELYSFFGVRLRSLYKQSLQKGDEVTIPFRSDNLDQGMYMLVLKTEYGTETRKLILTR